MKDPLGDRMKAFERAAEPTPLPRGLPVYARIDGRGFSRFTRGMRKPTDPRMLAAMQWTAAQLLERTDALAAYVQSDEISLLWHPAPEVEFLFGGRVPKLTSVLAGLATSLFTQALLADTDGLAAFVKRSPHFDTRLMSLPDRATAAGMFAWRGEDAKRNGLQQVARAHFGHAALQGKGIGDMLRMLEDAGNPLPEGAPLHGTLIRTTRRSSPIDPEIRAKIPAHARPAAGQLFERRVSLSHSTSHPGAIANLEAVLFDGADPLPRSQDTLSAAE